MASTGRVEEVFETPDVIEIASAVDPRVDHEQHHEDIDTAQVSPNEAFSIFTQREFNTDVPGRPAVFQSHEPSRSMEEPPLVRYHRLKQETAELTEQLEMLAQAVDSSKSVITVNPEEIAAASLGSVALERQLKELGKMSTMESILDPIQAAQRPTSLQKNLTKQLLQQVEGIGLQEGNNFIDTEGNKENNSDVVKEGNKINPGGLTYELYYNANTRKHNKDNFMSSIDTRLKLLEKVVGCDENVTRSKTLHGNTSGVSLIESLDSIGKKVNLLNKNTLDSVTRRMKALTAEFDLFSRKMAKARSTNAGINPVRQQRLQRMFEILEKFESTNEILPSLLKRLHSLRVIHEESALFTQRLSTLETTQAQSLRLLQEGKSALSILENSLSENMKNVQNNFDSIDARMKEISSN